MYIQTQLLCAKVILLVTTHISRLPSSTLPVSQVSVMDTKLDQFYPINILLIGPLPAEQLHPLCHVSKGELTFRGSGMLMGSFGRI